MKADPASQWYVISLRPRGEHATMRRAAARHGAGVIALSPWVLVPREDADTRRELHAALCASRVVFTSPAAVRAARRLRVLEGLPLVPPTLGAAPQWYGVGAGTASALRRAGAGFAQSPARMDSEGVLALPALLDVDGRDVGLVTAPGGRDALEPALRARGARVLRADVYTREPARLSTRALAALRGTQAPCVVAVSSAGALEQVLDRAPDAIGTLLRGLPLVAASERLAAHARALGFARVCVAPGPQPDVLVAAARAQASGSMR